MPKKKPAARANPEGAMAGRKTMLQKGRPRGPMEPAAVIGRSPQSADRAFERSRGIAEREQLLTDLRNLHIRRKGK